MDITDHYLICGFNPGLKEVLEQLSDSALGRHRLPIVVIAKPEHDDDTEKLISTLSSKWPHMFYIPGSIISEEDLKAAGALDARAILILPGFTEENPDLQTLFSSLALKSLFEKSGRSRYPKVIAKVNEPSYAHRISLIADKVVCAQERDYLLAAEAVINPRIIDVYRNLMTVSETTNEFYDVEIPEKWLHMSFQDLFTKLYDKSRNTGNPLILVGVQREDQLFLNPRMNELLNELKDFKKEDKLLIMAYNNPQVQIEEMN